MSEHKAVTDETKSFFGATREAAKKDARDWMGQQTDVVLVRERSEAQSEAGGWRVSVSFQRRRKPAQVSAGLTPNPG